VSVELDHVILGAPDLDATAARLESEHRLPSVPGGRHEGLGTANRIVPLGDAYLELLGVVDPGEAGANDFGAWLTEHLKTGEAWLGWSVRTDDLDATCERLGLEPMSMSRARPDGAELSWRVAGMERSREDPSLPFFIAWDVPDDELPGRAGGEVQASGARIAAVEVGADEAALTDWLGGDLPGTVRVADGAPGIQTVTVAGHAGVEVIAP
jgi:Glyoxalase-like domain